MDNKQVELNEDENDMMPLQLDISCEELEIDLEVDIDQVKNQQSNSQSKSCLITSNKGPYQDEGPQNDLIEITIRIPLHNQERKIKIKPRIQIIELTKKLEIDLDLEKNKNYSLSYYGQDLYNLNQTLEECMVVSGSTIVLKIPTEGGRYDPIGFSNMKNMELVSPSKNINCEPWRYCRSGLNLPGICKNKNCQAFDQEVICPQGNGTFNIAVLIHELRCPQCKQEDEEVVAVGDCYFWDCVYDFNGAVKKEGNKKITIFEKLNQECPKGKFVHFKGTNENDRNKWLSLVITTRKM